MKDVVILRPELQSSGRRWFYRFVTLLAWGIWVYLWLPLISLVAWFFGVQFFYEHLWLDGLARQVPVVVGYAAVASAFAVLLVSWSRYNLKRYGKKNRRKQAGRLEEGVVAEHFGLAPETLMRIQQSRKVVFHLSSDGTFEDILIAEPHEHPAPVVKLSSQISIGVGVSLE